MRSSPVKHTDNTRGESDTDLSADAQHVLSHALARRTRVTYLAYWKHYEDFCMQTRHCVATLPLSEVELVNFLAYMFTSGYGVSTVAAHSSALAYIHRLFQYQDFSNSFLVKQFLKGANNIRAVAPDTRLPITYELLRKIIPAIAITIKSEIHRHLFTSMCLLAFHGFLRIGEMCTTQTQTKSESSNAIQRTDVKFIQTSPVVGLEMTLKKFKHSKHPVTLFVAANSQELCMCPVYALKTYLACTRHVTGPLYQFPGGLPVTASFFNLHLNNVISFLGFDTSRYKSHSFRIGAATQAIMLGHSEDRIKKMGRWNSDALQHYVRLPCITVDLLNSRR